MIEEQKAKALFAGGVALFVTGLVVLMLLVIPAARQTQVAMAQDDMEPPMDEGMEDEMMLDEEMPPGMDGPGGPGGAPEEPAAPEGEVADPLEPSRANPFAPRAGVAAPDVAAVMAEPHYGPDWSQLPIAERVGFVAPEIPSAPTPPLPPIERAAEADIRITSILWDGSGGALAAYEGPEGKPGELRPGDRVPGTSMSVQEITRTGVTIENPRTGESEVLELRPRTERREQTRPQRQPRRPRGGGGGFPDAPQGG
ncbi:MAG: hypothetical protein ACLFU7_00675 [Armatimonadota bacterium]